MQKMAWDDSEQDKEGVNIHDCTATMSYARKTTFPKSTQSWKQTSMFQMQNKHVEHMHVHQSVSKFGECIEAF